MNSKVRSVRPSGRVEAVPVSQSARSEEGLKPLRALSTSPTVIILPCAPWWSDGLGPESADGLRPGWEVCPMAAPRAEPLAAAMLAERRRRRLRVSRSQWRIAIAHYRICSCKAVAKYHESWELTILQLAARKKPRWDTCRFPARR